VAGAAIPTTLQDLLLARLDRMASDKEVAQLGAVIGRTIVYGVIRAASSLDEATLRLELDKLVGAGLLFVKGSPPRAVYTFKHALIQDAAYQSLVKKRRQQLHQAVAERLEERFPEVAATQPELLARHFTEAGAAGRATDYWLAAGRRAQAAFANAEAIDHLRRGLAVIAGLPASSDRDARELPFQVSLGVALMTGRGYAHPDLEAVQTRARELCERLGPSSPLFHVLWGNWAWRLIRDEHDEAIRLAHRLAALAEERADRGLIVEAAFAVGITSLYRGEFAACRAACARCRELEDPAAALAHAAHTGQNVGMASRATRPWRRGTSGFRTRPPRGCGRRSSSPAGWGTRSTSRIAYTTPTGWRTCSATVRPASATPRSAWPCRRSRASRSGSRWPSSAAGPGTWSPGGPARRWRTWPGG
jgi:predicted ATPase